ncbi:hypothetical protein EDD21DRAFT_417856 [Dissophora ornata]|nr:hypothetical protein BGZ58_006060 [Dissophora ornata]KAI8598332.1 hypothetical protein EDD21DRAFT_417856 [Dissophora ornata]
MTNPRTFLTIVSLQALVLLLTALTTVPNAQVSAQFGLSVPCNDCLVKQISTLSSCVGVNLTDSAEKSTTQYGTCLCNASFDFNWTTPCETSCQTNEIQNFESNFPTLLKTGLNLTCVKPTPSPTPTPTSSSATTTTAMMKNAKVLMGWSVLASAVLTVLSTL